MTRNSDIRLEDITGCDHTPELPIVDDGAIVGWLCRCGREHPAGKQVKPKEDPCSPTSSPSHSTEFCTSALNPLAPGSQSVKKER